MRNSPLQGEQVTIRFSGTLASTSTSTSTNSGQVTLYDINSNVRTLLANERLEIDNLQVDMTSAQGAAVYLITAPQASGAVVNSHLLAEFPGNNLNNLQPVGQQDQDYTRQGRNCPIGVTPYVYTAIAMPFFLLIGDGRIVQTTQPGRQSWQAPLTPGGNF